MPSSIQCLSPWCCRAGRTITSAVAVHQSLMCVCEGDTQRSLSWLMRLHCPNLTANPIVMLCTLMAEGARPGQHRAGLCSTGHPLLWCLLKTERRGWWILLGLGTSITIRRGEGSPTEARTSGRERSAALGTLSSTNSCAVFFRVMQLFCSQII